jgi:antitoxin component of MazEF toxin-antitoxin module
MYAIKLHKYRNASGVILSSKVLREAGLSRDDTVVVTVHDGVIEIRKAHTEEADVLEGVEIALTRYSYALRELAK